MLRRGGWEAWRPGSGRAVPAKEFGTQDSERPKALQRQSAPPRARPTGEVLHLTHRPRLALSGAWE